MSVGETKVFAPNNAEGVEISRPHPTPNTPRVLGAGGNNKSTMMNAPNTPDTNFIQFPPLVAIMKPQLAQSKPEFWSFFQLVSPCESQKKPCLVKSTLIVPAQLLLKIQTSWCLKLNPIKVTIKTTMKNAHVSIIKSPLNPKLCCSNPGNRCCLQGLSLNSQGQGVAIVLHQDLARALR
jgi:hypothetical protein